MIFLNVSKIYVYNDIHISYIYIYIISEIFQRYIFNLGQSATNEKFF